MTVHRHGGPEGTLAQSGKLSYLGRNDKWMNQTHLMGHVARNGHPKSPQPRSPIRFRSRTFLDEQFLRSRRWARFPMPMLGRLQDWSPPLHPRHPHLQPRQPQRASTASSSRRKTARPEPSTTTTPSFCRIKSGRTSPANNC